MYYSTFMYTVQHIIVGSYFLVFGQQTKNASRTFCCREESREKRPKNNGSSSLFLSFLQLRVAGWHHHNAPSPLTASSFMFLVHSIAEKHRKTCCCCCCRFRRQSLGGEVLVVFHSLCAKQYENLVKFRWKWCMNWRSYLAAWDLKGKRSILNYYWLCLPVQVYGTVQYISLSRL